MFQEQKPCPCSQNLKPDVVKQDSLGQKCSENISWKPPEASQDASPLLDFRPPLSNAPAALGAGEDNGAAGERHGKAGLFYWRTSSEFSRCNVGSTRMAQRGLNIIADDVVCHAPVHLSHSAPLTPRFCFLFPVSL
eukprot:3056117-Pyramimonas_sp.AAC.1